MKKKIKRISCFLASIIFVVILLATTCLAYSPPLIIDGSGNIAVDTTRSFAFVNSDNQVVIYGYKLTNPTFPTYDGYNIYVDSSILDLFNTIPYSSFTFIALGSNITLESAISIVDSYILAVRSGVNGSSALNEARELALDNLVSLNYLVQYYSTLPSGTNIVNEVFDSYNIDYDYNEFVNLVNNAPLYQVENYHEIFLILIAEMTTLTFDKYEEQLQLPTYENGYTVGYEQGYLDGEQSTNAYQSGFAAGESQGYNNGYSVGYDNGYEQGGFDIGGEMYDKGYAKGYTDGGTDSGLMKNTLITIFSSPYYILNEVFDFDIFGVSVAGVIMFVISIILVGFVIKLII